MWDFITINDWEKSANIHCCQKFWMIWCLNLELRRENLWWLTIVSRKKSKIWKMKKIWMRRIMRNLCRVWDSSFLDRLRRESESCEKIGTQTQVRIRVWDSSWFFRFFDELFWWLNFKSKLVPGIMSDFVRSFF